MVTLLEVFVVLFVGIIFILLIGYILIIGRIGWQFFKYNFPMTKKRGAHWLILGRDGRFKYLYSKFKSVYEWPDKTKSYISKNFDRIVQTAEPLIFLVEGYPTNARLAQQLPPEEMSRLVNNLMKEIESASRLEAELGEKKTLLMDKIVPILTMGLAGGSLLIGIAIIMNLSEMSDQITNVINLVNEFRPQIQAALDNLTREI